MSAYWGFRDYFLRLTVFLVGDSLDQVRPWKVGVGAERSEDVNKSRPPSRTHCGGTPCLLETLRGVRCLTVCCRGPAQGVPRPHL